MEGVVCKTKQPITTMHLNIYIDQSFSSIFIEHTLVDKILSN